MTCCGFTSSAGGGYCWSDSEWFRDDQPAGSVEKLTVAGNIVAVSTGYLSLTQGFCRLVGDLGRASIVSATERLPALLRQARDGFRADLHSVDMDYDPHTVYALCGVSDGCFRGFFFDEAHNLEPVERASWSSPNVRMDVNCASDILELAQRQLGYVRQKSPTATGGQLTIAKLGPARVVTTSIALLIADERPPRPVAPPSVTGDTPAHFVAAHRAAEAERVRKYWGFG